MPKPNIMPVLTLTKCCNQSFFYKENCNQRFFCKENCNQRFFCKENCNGNGTLLILDFLPSKKSYKDAVSASMDTQNNGE